MSSGSGRSGGQQAQVSKEMEKRAVELMLNGQSPADAMRESGCNYEVGGRDYGRVYKRFTRRKKCPGKKKKVKTNNQLASQSEKELAACKSMLEKQTGPLEAMIDAGFCFFCVKICLFIRLYHFFAGCNYSTSGSDYRRVYQRFWRKTTKAQQKATAAQTEQASRQLKLFQEKQESLQFFKRQANRAEEEANRQGERCRLLEKKIEDLERELQQANARYVITFFFNLRKLNELNVCRAQANAEQYRGLASEHAAIAKKRRDIVRVGRKLKQQESVQAHKHEANRQAERCRVLQKKNEDLRQQLETALSRYVKTTFCCRFCCVCVCVCVCVFFDV